MIATIIICSLFSIFIVNPLIIFSISKLFRAHNSSFKNSIIVSILLFILSLLAFLLWAFLRAFGPIGSIIGALIIVAALAGSVLIIKTKFEISFPRSIGVFVACLLLFSCVHLFFKEFVVQAYKIPSRGMEPTILKGDFFLVNKYIYQLIEPETGDIIVFPFPEDTSKDFIQRVVGVEGDEIEIIDKQVYVNQQKLLESYVINTDPVIIPKDARPRDNLGPLTVPPNSLFVLGDNRDHSYDSRFWGFVDRRQVKGKASLIYWSWSQDDSRVRRERIGVSIDWKSHAVAH